MLIFVVVLQSGERVTLEVELDDTMQNIKMKLWDKVGGTPPEELLLVYDGLVIADETKTIGDLGITRETTINTILKAEHERTIRATDSSCCICCTLM